MLDKIEALKKLVTEADALAAEIGAHPHFGKAPQALPIRTGIHNGALIHIEGLQRWAELNPEAGTAPASKTPAKK